MRWPSTRPLSALGKAAFNGICAYAEQNNIQIDGLPEVPRPRSPEQALHIIHNFLAIQFSCCSRPALGPVPQPDPGVRQP
jgi:hypothetical protein